MGVLRYFFNSASQQNIAKGALAALRKKTGYTFANCRKALQLHDNDAVKAEKWLKEQAKILGWNTAIKVQNRQASQGLIGIAFENKKMAMVEVNCETDFVSKNESFKKIVELATTTCLKYPVLTSGQDTNRISINAETLGQLKTGNESLADHLAVLIGSVGENMTLRRAFCFETIRDDVNIAVSVHPPCNNSRFMSGKYGSFISYQKEANASPEFSNSLQLIGHEICNHIIGMNPTKVGDSETDVPCRNPDNEKALIFQEFLFDDSKTVAEILNESGIKILEFKRFECGEPESEEEETEPPEDINLEQAKEVAT